MTTIIKLNNKQFNRKLKINILKVLVNISLKKAENIIITMAIISIIIGFNILRNTPVIFNIYYSIFCVKVLFFFSCILYDSRTSLELIYYTTAIGRIIFFYNFLISFYFSFTCFIILFLRIYL